jgi:hypothetical protein
MKGCKGHTSMDVTCSSAVASVFDPNHRWITAERKPRWYAWFWRNDLELVLMDTCT